MKQLLWFSLAIFFGTYICTAVGDPDLWWHITIGRWIVAHGTVPTQDIWNMFSSGEYWRAYSWSLEIVFALVDRLAGGKGLLLLQMSVACLLSLSLFFAYSRISRSSLMGAVLGAYTTVACFNHDTLRPQSLVWILFVLSIAVADSIVERGLSKARMLALVCLGSAWANIHLTAVLGLGSIVLWSLQDSAHRYSLKRALATGGCFFLGTLITPYLGGEWLTFIAKGGHPLRYSAIAEFQPATILQYSTVFVVLMGTILIAAFQSDRATPPASRLVLGAGMTLAGLTAVKFIPFAAITLSAMCAVWWRQSGSTPNSRGTDHLAEGLRQVFAAFNRLEPNTYGAIAILAIGMTTMNVSALLRQPVEEKIIPKSAVDFIDQHGLKHPILNEFGSGGYLMYRYSDERGEPRYKVAIDGRTNVNPPEVWDLYMASFSGRANWDEYIKKANAETILWRQGSPMTSLLLLSPDWCRVYGSGDQDESFVVFIKRQDFEAKRGELTSIDCS
jgi:hypothetical protein